MTISKKAEAAAALVCCAGCFAGYETCEKEQHTEVAQRLELVGTNPTCPLHKYNVPFNKPEFLGPRPTLDDGFWLCANCEHGELAEEGSDMVVNRVKLIQVCVDCPVKFVEENIQECLAEAMGG